MRRTNSAIFVHIQKTGGNAIRTALGYPTNPREKHYTARELRDFYGHDNWAGKFTFAFVRNPWDRLVSWWSMIDALRPAYLSGQALNAFQTMVLERASTFQEFLENCDERIIDDDGTKWIYQNQLDYVSDEDGRLLVDFVGRFEHLQRDFEVVARKILGAAVPLPHSNPSRHAHYSTYYSRAMAEKVGQRYAKDRMAFAYKFGD
jgi:hypothetical protein